MSTSSLAASSLEDLTDIGRNAAIGGSNTSTIPDLETRLRCLNDVERKIYEILEISKEILQSFDKERQVSFFFLYKISFCALLDYTFVRLHIMFVRLYISCFNGIRIFEV